MEKWFVIRNGKERGPFTNAQVKQLAAAGKLKPEDILRKDGEKSTTPAIQVIGLFLTQESSSQENSQESREYSSDDHTKTPADSLIQRAKKSAFHIAEITKLQAKLKSLEAITLPILYQKLATKILELKLEDSVLESHLEILNSIDQQIELLQLDAPTDPKATLSDKAKQAGMAAVSAAKCEKLKLKRKKILIEIGIAASQNEVFCSDSRLESCLSEIEKTTQQIKDLQQQIAQLNASSGGRSMRKKVVYAATVLLGIAFLWYGSSLFSRSTPRTQQADSLVQTAVEELEQKQREARAEAEEIRRKIEDARITNEKKMDLAKAERELELQQAQLQAEKDRSLKKERMRAEEAERRKNAELQSQQEQVHRKEFADRLFSGITLTPSEKISLSRSLQQDGASLELRGENYATIQKLHQAKDWLGLLNKLSELQNRGYYHEFPPTVTIEDIFYRGFNLCNFYVLLRTKTNYSPQTFGGSRLRYIGFPISGDHSFLMRGTSWLSSSFERHPDGIGYLTKWNPTYGSIIMYVSKGRKDDDHIRQVVDRLYDVRKDLEKKQRLGELDNATMQVRFLAAIKQARNDVLSWARER
tara:strand:- start:618 stop:2378 length:1761 start_codon:yes stop_codon:yes gene_type:complete